MKIRTYNELIRMDTFADRFNYLSLRGVVGRSTFGFDRYVNQRFYTSVRWRQIRHEVIVRDNACDLGMTDYDIHSRLLIHHMNPVTIKELMHDANVLNPEFLITTTHVTHNAIHYGDASLLSKPFVKRHAGDTRLW